MDPSFDMWENPRPHVRQTSLRISEPSSNPSPPSRKAEIAVEGKGKAVAEEDEDFSDNDDLESSPMLFEMGSGSGLHSSPPFGESLLPIENHLDPLQENNTDAEEGKSVFGNESIPTDWEDRVDGQEDDTELTAEDLRILEECEKTMILEAMMEEDDLLGEELAEDERRANEAMVESLERTISEDVRPIVHVTSGAVPTSSQSPTSKRERSPPRVQAAKAGSKKKTPKSPKTQAAASKKLKVFQGKSSPKRKAPSSYADSTKEKRKTSDPSIPPTEVIFVPKKPSEAT
ncbi:uncharacterized protein LOC112081595 [Eutrema salsugineum]|uniref:uncharacterized protein LOC112081595 n=1 Tax=Eutrema salsugineum TaxID=72664 RepID=UPI000CED6C8E|nr:uncharacterized protein LOC112081595 [Eutrema salsugineum]